MSSDVKVVDQLNSTKQAEKSADINATSNIAISVKNVGKCFQIYDRPQDRLKQSIFRGRRQYYREFWALKDVSFEVKKGETIGIIGRNGSGKSTLLQIIAGTLSPTEGEVQVNGRVAALLELGSGFNPEFTGRENVFMNGAILGLSKEDTDSLFEDIVAFADIGDFIDQPVKTYSSGMAVRLAFAVQAMIPKEVLIVDEALAVGDELFQRKCYAKIEEFKRQGGTILFVSHSGSTIIELCDRAMLLDSGESLLIGPSKRVVNLYQKYIYAPASKKELIRQEMIEQSQQFSGEVNTKVQLAGTQKRAERVEQSSEAKQVRQRAMYDPFLVPKETLQYESRGAKIYNPEITTLTGEKVNLLIPGDRYIWRYYVKFHKPCQNLRFGMLIKTASGFELGGSVSSFSGEGVSFLQSGDIVKVEFTFTPRLNTGTYFLNGGVLGLTEEGEVYLDRGIDLAAFKILHNEDSLMTSIVDFSVVPEVIEVAGPDIPESKIEGFLHSLHEC